jgi:hypothetical protein
MTITLPDWFWDNVDKFGTIVRPELGHCWEWTRGTRTGYGNLRDFTGRQKTIGAHRIVYEALKGDPTGFQVCHRCDNRRCVRPEHLFLGTAKVNNDDKLAKERGNSTLPIQDVKDIYNSPITRTMVNDLAIQYAVAEDLIRRILTGRSFEFYTGGENRNIPRQQTRSKLSPEAVADILTKPYHRGSGKAMAEKYGVSKVIVSKLRNGLDMRGVDTQ